MDENAIRSIIQDELQKYATKNQYNASKIPVHTHNGVDSSKISQKNILNNSKYQAFLTSSDTATPGGETFTLSNLPNISQMFFNGIASNNASNTSLPGTLKASVVGQVQFGNCYGNLTSGQVTDVRFSNIASSFEQNSSSLYVDSTTLANCRIGVSAVNFAYVIDNTSSIVASATVVSYTNSSIKITTVLGSNWQITGSFILI